MMIKTILASFMVLWTMPLCFSQESDESDEPGSLKKAAKPLYFENEFKVRELIEKADRALKKDETENALRLFQKLADDYPRSMVASKNSIIPAWRYTLDRISELPDETRKLYGKLFTPEATEWLKKAMASQDASLIEDVAARYFHTEAGYQAAEYIANLYTEQNNLHQAMTWTRLLVATRRTTAPASHLARLAQAAARFPKGSIMDYIKKTTEEKKLWSEKILVGSASITLGDYLSRLATEVASPPHAGSPAPPAVSFKPSSLTWQNEIPDGKALAPPNLSRSRTMPGYSSGGEYYIYVEDGGYTIRVPAGSQTGRYPFTGAVQDNVLAVNLGKSIYLHDMTHDGKVLWTLGGELNLMPFLGSLKYRRPYPYYFTTTAKGYIVATMEGERKDGVTAPRNKLVVIDPLKRALVWRSDWIKELQDFSFNGCPLPSGDRIYIGATLHEKPDEVYFMALDLETGMILWKRFLVEGGTPTDKNAYDTAITPTLGLDGETLFCATNRGVIAALNASTGEILWATSYGASPGEAQWAPNPVLVHRGRVIAAPMDSNYLFILDGTTGETLKKSSRGDGKHLLGIVHDILFIGGQECSAVDLNTLSIRWTWEAPYGQYVGKGLLSQDSLLIPTQSRMFRLKLDSGDIHDMFSWEKPEHAGMIMIHQKRMIAVSEQFITTYQ